MMCRYGYILMR